MVIVPGIVLAVVNLGVPTGCDPAVMGEGYWKKWNPEVQAEIESDIEKWRKADGVFAVPVASGTEVAVEQDSPSGRVTWCHVAGFNGVFHPADAIVEGNTLIVSSPKVLRPLHVRYAWAKNPEGANLYNKEGLPAPAFRW